VTVDDGLCRSVREALLTQAGNLASDSPAVVRERIAILVHQFDPLLDGAAAQYVITEVFEAVAGLGAIEPLLRDPEISEVMLNGPGVCFVERNGRLEAVPIDLSARAIESIAQRVIAPLGLRLDRSSLMVDARLADGSRLHAVLAPLAPDGPIVTIRRFCERTIEVGAFCDSVAVEEALLLHVRERRNVLISGATNAGKTTLLNALASAAHPLERIVTIEETAELQIHHPHVVRLEAHPANGEGAGGVSVRDLVRAALRMRPDRIVIGEVRGGEALDLLQALNTGHRGSLCTVHANSAHDALSRLETLSLMSDVAIPMEALVRQIDAAIDVVVHVERDSEGRRRVVEILERFPRDGVQIPCSASAANRGIE
jgi:pilus assembly protein CpaF